MIRPVFVAALLIALPFAGAGASEPGKALYSRHCVSCHAEMTGGDGSVLYRRADSLVSNMAELKSRVDYCQHGLKLGWSDTDIDKVADYLNRHYYHFH